MAAVESRCDRCETTRFQCWNCQKRDKEALAALKSQKRLKSSSAKDDPDLHAAIAASLELEPEVKLAIAASLKTQEPRPVLNQEGMQRQVLLRTALLQNFIISKTPRDGNCLFHAFARGLVSVGVFKKKPTQAFVRQELAKFLIASGKTELPTYWNEREDGSIVLGGVISAIKRPRF